MSDTRCEGPHASTFHVLTWHFMWPDLYEDEVEDGDFYYDEDED
jgi:hypothetical protein